MSIRPSAYASVNRYPVRRPTFIPRAPIRGGVGAGLGGSAGGVGGLLRGIACPLICLGCLATLALLGLFGTMIAAAAYMNGIQSQLRKSALGAGSTFELNILVLFGALLSSIYVLSKHRRGAAISN